VLSVRKADASDCADPAFALKVLDLLNNAYRQGEKGLLEEPWSRACKEDVTELLTGQTDAQGSQFMLIAEFVPGIPIGCAKVKINRTNRRGEVGLLAVEMEYQRRGVAKTIMGKAEEACAVTRCSNLDLELLVPVGTEHEFKSLVVKKWYERLGFVKQSSEVVKAGTEMPCRTKPKVAVDCDLGRYTKPIRRDSLSISTAYRIQSITEEELKKRIAAKSALIVDLRGKDYVGGHIPGTTNLPFADNDEFSEKIKSIGADSSCAVVFICMYSKQYSPLAASIFLNHIKQAKVTRDVFILTGGFHRWLNTQNIEELAKGKCTSVAEFDAAQFVDLKGGNGLGADKFAPIRFCATSSINMFTHIL
jgi:Cdc25 family phosphatase